MYGALEYMVHLFITLVGAWSSGLTASPRAALVGTGFIAGARTKLAGNSSFAVLLAPTRVTSAGNLILAQ